MTISWLTNTEESIQFPRVSLLCFNCNQLSSRRMRFSCKSYALNCAKLSVSKEQRILPWNLIYGAESVNSASSFQETSQIWVRKVEVEAEEPPLLSIFKMPRLPEQMAKVKTKMMMNNTGMEANLEIGEMTALSDLNHLIISRRSAICSETVSTSINLENTCKIWEATSTMIILKFSEVQSRLRLLISLTAMVICILKSSRF